MTTTTYDFGKTQQLGKQREETLAHSKAVVAKAAAENRDLTAPERQAVEAAVARVKELDAELKEQKSAMVKAVINLGTAEDDYDGTGNGVFSEAARHGIVTALKSRTAFRTEVDRKALLGSNAMLPPSGTGVAGGLHPNLRPIAELLRNQPANGPVVRYYRLDGATAGVVAEGAVKPDSGVTVTPVDVALQKIATTATFSDEMIDDAGYLVDHLAGELQKAVVVRENKLIVDTFNATSGVLTGTGAAGTVVDLVADAMAGQEAINGAAPTAVIAHPTAVATIRKAKADTSGAYTVDPLTSAPATLHGIPLISTPATDAGVVWVIGGPGVTVYRRGPITAEIGHTGDDWVTNTRTMRVEQRLAVAVVRPSMLTRVTLT